MLLISDICKFESREMCGSICMDRNYKSLYHWPNGDYKSKEQCYFDVKRKFPNATSATWHENDQSCFGQFENILDFKSHSDWWSCLFVGN